MTTDTAFFNISATYGSAAANVTRGIFERHEFLISSSEIAIPLLVILGIASIVGTLGNLLILMSVATTKELQNIESIFIVNLACSDLYVTMVADPMSIVAKIEGEDFFNMIPGLCRTIGSLCTISCVNSLMTIAGMSFNRYVHICHHTSYKFIFSPRASIGICGGFYCVGTILVLLNLGGYGDHSFDRKSLECIWDRMASYPYTVIFTVAMVWVPVFVTGFSYLRIFTFVFMSRRRIQQQTATQPNGRRTNQRATSSHLAKTLFIVYAVFTVCWTPYALLIVVDSNDEFSHEIHVIITAFAHLHPSINWLVYYLTNRKFSAAFYHLLGLERCKLKKRFTEMSITESKPASNAKGYR